MVTGVKHMAIAVRDVHVALRGYQDVLGVREVTHRRLE